MKKSLFILGLVFIISTGFAFNEVISYLKGRAETDAVVLEWQSASETGVNSYSIERSDIHGTNFSEITTITAKGSNSKYTYRDAIVKLMHDGNAPVPLSDLYKYRLKINYEKEISYSQTISVTKPSAGVKRTWGMIKEMFR